MISIIICSRTNTIDTDLRSNIEATIGVVYEIICIDNSKNQYNIFQAYNIGISKSVYSVVCFMHDDVRFHTKKWGHKIINHLKGPEVGLIGVGGPRFLSCIPGIWWGGGIFSQPSDMICQYNIDTDRNDIEQSHMIRIQPIPENKIEVAALDGLFLCSKKNVFQNISFDEETYHDFHFYDLDISLQIKSCGYKIYCIYDVLVEHISASNINMKWISSSRIFYDKWKRTLPVCIYDVSEKEKTAIEYSHVKIMLRLLAQNGWKNLFSFYTIKEILFIPYFYYRYYWLRMSNFLHKK